MSPCKRVGLPWGWPCWEVYLHLDVAAAPRGEEMAVRVAHPMLPVFTLPVSLNHLLWRRTKGHFRDQEEGEKPLVCLHPA